MRFFYILICVVFVTITNAQNELNSNLSAKVDQLNNEIITYKSSGELNLAASALNKLAYLYWNNNNTDEALKCFLQSATINEKLKNHNGKKFLYDNIAILYSDKQNCEKAQEYFIRSLKIVQSQGNKKVEIKSLVNLAVSYTECDNSKEAISYLNKALIIAKVLNDLKLIRNIYGQLAENYEINGDSQKSMEAFNFFSTFDKYVRDLEQKDKDQAHNQHISELANKTKHAEDVASEKQKALDNSIIQLKQTSDSLLLVEKMNEQQQEKLKAQERALIEKEARIKLANRFRNTIIFSLIILLSILILLYRQFTQKKKVNALLLEQNETLKQQKNKIEKHKDELEQINYQLNLKNIQILDSITYAKKIQDAILPYEKTIREKIPNFFIFYKPRDIVSGDFYWYSEKNGKHFIAAVDCTGHGVPGAFMSMIGNTLLNEIVNEKNIDKPSEILKRLNDGIVKILNQNKTKKDIQGDGMDISLCSIDLKNNILEMALANQYGLLFENNHSTEIIGDIYTIGGVFALHEKNTFTNHVVNIKKGTTVYMLSDGFQDQFGGIDSRKFMTQNVNNLISSMQSYSMNEQKQIIQKKFEEWKGSQKQIDDILIIGIRF